MNLTSLLVAALQGALPVPGATADSIRAAVPMIFQVVSAETPSGRYVGVLVPKRPPPSLLQPVVREHGHMIAYLLLEGIGFQQSSVLDTGRDTVTLHRDFAAALVGDSTFMASLVPLAEARLLPDPGDRPRHSMDRAVAIGARLFYPDELLPNGEVQSRVCADARGLRDLDGPRDHLLEAFVFQALARVNEADHAKLFDPYEQLVRQAQAGGASSIEAIRTSVWDLLERDAFVREIVVASYAQHASTLPFRLQ